MDALPSVPVKVFRPPDSHQAVRVGKLREYTDVITIFKLATYGMGKGGKVAYVVPYW